MNETHNARRESSSQNLTKYVHVITFFLIGAFAAIIGLNELNHWQQRLMISKSTQYHFAIADHSLAILNELQAVRLWYLESMETGEGARQRSTVHNLLTAEGRINQFSHVLTPHMKEIIALQHEYADPHFSRITDRLRSE